MIEKLSALVFDQTGIAPRVSVDLQLNTLGDPLRMVNLSMRGLIGDFTSFFVSLDVLRHVWSVGKYELIVQAREKNRASWISLPSGTSAKLSIQTATRVTGRSDDVEPAQFGDSFSIFAIRAAESDVRTSAAHLCGNRN